MKKTLIIVAAVAFTAWMAYFVNQAHAVDAQRMQSVMTAASGSQP